jgi:hypothetical protein
MARVLKVIWVRRERIYFCKRDWTAQITLIRLKKLAFSRKADPGYEPFSLTLIARTS